MSDCFTAVGSYAHPRLHDHTATALVLLRVNLLSARDLVDHRCGDHRIAGSRIADHVSRRFEAVALRDHRVMRNSLTIGRFEANELRFSSACSLNLHRWVRRLRSSSQVISLGCYFWFEQRDRWLC